MPIERLESRRLLAATVGGNLSTTTAGAALVTSAALVAPSVAFTNPLPGTTGVPRDVFFSADVHAPNGGINDATLSPSTVKLVRIRDGRETPVVLNTSGGGDVIVVKPVSPLDANAVYTFVITSGLKDVAGVGFVPYAASFQTGTTLAQPDTRVAFQQVTLTAAQNRDFTCVTFGPDNKLYAATLIGEILRFSVNADGTLGTPQVFSAIRNYAGGNRLVLGLAFDPASTANNLILYASNSWGTVVNAQDFSGKITRLTGPNLETLKDMVIHLPRGALDHATNQLSFGPDGALYFPQGSESAMGAPDPAWARRSEHLLNAAVLRLDLAKLGNNKLDVHTEDADPYDPFAPDSPLTIYATGVRNAYDLVWTQNGELYAPTNGSAAGGATPGTPSPFAGPYSPRIDSAANGPYTGPEVPAIPEVIASQNDFLFQIEPNGYYGHPNPKRNEFVLNGGNPTAGVDPAEVTQYPVGTQPDRNYRGFEYDFGAHQSPDGAIEYRSTRFNGALSGAMLITRYSGGDDIIVLRRDGSGNFTQAQTNVVGFTGLNNPIDLVENRANGNLYVAELGGRQIVLLRPIEPTTAPSAPTGLTMTGRASSTISLKWNDTSTNETSFKIERRLLGQSTFSTILVSAPNATTFTDTGLTANTGYEYRISAANSAGTSATTPVLTISTAGVNRTIDSADKTAVTLTGSWDTRTASTATGGSFLTDNNSGKGDKSARFSLNVPAAGTYKVAIRYSALAGSATNVPVDVIHAGGTTTVLVNQTAGANTWVNLGTFQLAPGLSVDAGGAVVVRTTGTNGFVNVDAVMFTTIAPLSPSSLSVTKVLSPVGAKLTWTDRSSGEVGFIVERRLARTTTFAEIARVAANVVTFTDASVLTGQSYVYRVKSYVGEISGPSNEASVTA